VPNAPRVAVVITTRDRLSFLPEAVASVEAQTIRDRELVVVDDQSSDGTAEWLATVEAPWLRAIALRTRHERGLARNRGLAEVTAPHVLFLDDDDRLRPDALALLLDALDRHPETVAAVGARWKFHADGSGSRINYPKRELVRRPVFELLAGAGWAPIMGQSLFRTAVVRELGGFQPPPPVYSEDRDLWLRLFAAGPVTIVPSIVVEHRTHPGQTKIPQDIAEVRERIYQRAIDALPVSERRRAARVRAGGRWWSRADVARESGRRGVALACYARAALTAPELTVSPLMWPALLHGVRQSLWSRR
jgi:GT2 family glycosyltransferase